MDNIYSLCFLFISFSIFLVFFIISNWTLSQTKNIKLKHLEEGLTNSPIFRFIKYLAQFREQHIYATYFYIILTSFLLGSLLSKIILHFNFQIKYFNEEYILIFIVLSLLFLALLIGVIDFLKGIFSFNAEKTLITLSPLIFLFCKSISFFPKSIIKISNKFLKNLGRGTKRAIGNLFSTKELSDIFEESSKNGLIEDEEKELLKGVIDFSDTRVKEIMTPRHEIVYVQYDENLFDVAETFSKEGFSRLIVCDKELDNVKGIVLAKDALAQIIKCKDIAELKNRKIKDILRQAYFVRENKQVDELLQEFRQQGIHLAIVLDEHGGVEGLITIEDLIEEIVGDIIDEHDLLDKKDCDFIKNSEGIIMVSGLLSIHDFNEDYMSILPEGEYETIAGFMIKKLSKMPKRGDNFDYNGFHFVVESLVENRINKIKILPLKKEEEKEI